MEIEALWLLHRDLEGIISNSIWDTFEDKVKEEVKKENKGVKDGEWNKELAADYKWWKRVAADKRIVELIEHAENLDKKAARMKVVKALNSKSRKTS